MDTIPAMMIAARKDRGGIALRYRRGGEWVSRTWDSLEADRRAISRALVERGIEPGDRVAVLSETRWEWTLTDSAVLGVGGVVVGVYTTLTADKVRYLLEHSGARAVFVDTEAQHAKVREILHALPDLEVVVRYEGEAEGAESFAALLDEGRDLDEREPAVVDEARSAVSPEDLATIVYTSGTTGDPKGAELTHKALTSIGVGTAEVLGLSESDVAVGFLPLAHVLTRVGSYSAAYAGLSTWLVDVPAQAGEAFQAAQPTVLAVVPRVFEKIHATMLAKVQQASPVKQRLFEAALKIGHEVAARERAGKQVGATLKAKHAFFDRLVLSKLRAATFGSRARRLNSGGAPIGPELLEFFHAIGILILEGYGLTETSSPCTLNRPGAYRFGSVGQAMPGCEIKIAEDGEVLVKGPGLFRGYFQNPEATAEAFTEDGWFKTGDLGALDDDGFLSITGRKKELLITAQGKNVAPAPIENKLKEHPLISQAVLIGDRRPYIAALITVDEEIAPLWAERRGAALTSEMVRAEVEARIEEVNRGLARYEQIKRFELLEGDFSVEEGTLTPSLKVKRPVVHERYEEAIARLYE
jgi:long-chain acyl-CoA synthetase